LTSNGEIYQRIGKLIRTKRLAMKPKVTQEELARRIHLKRTSITNIEKGRQKLLVHTLFDIAAALDIPPTALIPISKTDSTTHQLKGLRPDEQEFARSVLAKKLSNQP
jgi:transcriptional regulator with XRE-family HTH domain